MSDPTTSLNVMAAVRQNGGQFVCIVRWMLGTGDDLPHAQDVFDVALNLTEQDGSPVAEVARATVSPRLFFMIDPPREPRPLDYPGGDILQWLVAVRPTEGVDCAGADSGTLDGRAFGVCHLLSETDKSRVEWRAARVMFQAMSRRGLAASRFASVMDAAATETSARTFARALLRSRIRPIDLKPHLEDSFRDLVAASANRAERSTYDASGTTGLLQVVGADVGRQFAHAAMVVDALADREVVDALDRAIAPPQQVRQHVRLRVLHGGEFVDYWADPDGAGGPVADRDRGKRYSASELIGCGVRFDITPADLGQWIKDKRTLVAEVVMRSRSVSKRRDQPFDAIETGGKPGNIITSDTRAQFDPAVWPIDYTLLKRAQLMGSSAPPELPSAARVNYAMYQSDAARSPGFEFKTAKGPALGYSTGDGRVEIVIDRPPSTRVLRSPGVITPGSPLAPQTAVGGFNVYGMWEGTPETAPFFDDPSKNPTLDELRPWLITRRYSYVRDLKEAFPPIGGAVHPALGQALADPPWQPVLIAPSKVLDLDKKEELPSFSPDGGTAFAFDLRKGMSKGMDNGLFIGWDGAAPASVLWSPERMRDGAAVPGAWHHPQRYRFWVTSVDAFDQESAPVPVRTDDADAGETAAAVLFGPRRRAPLLGPPGSGQGFQLALAFDAAAGRLTVTFETALENQVAGRNEATPIPPRVDKAALSAVVVIWRRRLTRRIDDSLLRRTRGLRTGSIPDLPQWADADASMRKDGWRFFTDLRVAAPAAGDVWTASAAISVMDSGWEYRAGVGFTVNDDRAPFWAPNVQQTGTSGRVAMLANRTSTGSYEQVKALVFETPRASDVAMTNVEAVPNNAPGRAAQASTSRVWPAFPVPAPPGIRRDVVLLRLLTNDFSDKDVQLPRTPWRDTEVPVTIGQAKMCDTALVRTPVDGAPLPPDDAMLEPTRKALGAAFAAREISGAPLRQHPTLGFRGLIDLRWHYVPLSMRAISAASPEAEAVRFRVYATRAPQDDADGFATVLGSGQLTSADTYAITLTKGDPEGWATIAEQNVPTLVRIFTKEMSDIYGYVVDAGTKPGSPRWVRIARPPGDTRPLPNTAALQLFAAQPMSEVDTSSFEAESDYRHLLPIGGGDPDVFAWWVVGVSAQGKEASRLESPAAIELFVGTLEPQTPAAFHVSPPTDFTAHLLSPKSPWVPTDLITDDDAKFSPRLVLTWAEAPPHSGLSIIIERDERAAASPAKTRMRLHTVSAWQAIQTLEGIPEGSDIDASLLAAIADNWLLGSIVDVEGSPVHVYEHVKRDDRRGRIDATNGLKHVPSQEPSDTPGVPRMRPAFIDYFGRNDNLAVVMDANWEFRYRLRFFSDLGKQLPDAWRFLISRPTEWSPWLLPETTPLDVRAVKSEKNETDKLKAPQVRFKFVPRRAALLRAMGAFDDLPPEHHWEFRVVVRRRVNVPLLNTGLTPDVWIDVGGPVRIQGSNANELVDAEIERGWPGDRPQFFYRILVQQFLIVETAGGAVEKLVRGFDIRQPHVGNCDVPVDLDVPAAPTAEVEMIQTIEIT